MGLSLRSSPGAGQGFTAFWKPDMPEGRYSHFGHVTYYFNDPQEPVLGSFISSDVTMRALGPGYPALICPRTSGIIGGVNCRAAG